MRKDDVRGEEGRIGERKRDADRFPTQKRACVSRYTPAVAATTAAKFRPIRAATTARTIGPMNSIAATVASGSRSMEM